MGSKRKRVYEVVKNYELDPIVLNDGDDSIQFKVEIVKPYRSEKEYEARLYRIEVYRIQPAFPQKEGAPSHHEADEELMVRDDSLLDDDIKGQTPEEVLEKVINKINETFGEQAGY